MIHRLVIALLMTFALPACQAKEAMAPTAPGTQPPADAQKQVDALKPGLREEIYQKARKRNGGKEPTTLDLWDELVRKAGEETGAMKSYGKPRIVAKGAKPEIVINREGDITYNGKPLELGADIKDWEAIIGRGYRHRGDDKPPKLLAWDDLGIDVLTGYAADDKDKVKQLTLYLNKRPKDPYEGMVTTRPDGTPIKPLPDFTPRQAFTGYLELDGFGIDAKTEFWEILTTANPARNLRCGLRDCSHPHGALFGKTDGSLYLILNRGDEHGNIYEFTISR